MDEKHRYILHHQLKDAAASYAADTAAALRLIFSPNLSPGTDSEASAPAPVTSDRLYVDGVAEPMWKRRPQPHAEAGGGT